jgi:hypothetical protein
MIRAVAGIFADAPKQHWVSVGVTPTTSSAAESEPGTFDLGMRRKR